jgi:hypothetical protein
MKYLSIKSMAWMAAMVSTSVSAQSVVPDESIDVSNQFTITKVKYQAEDEIRNKSFSGYYYLNIAASGSTPTDATGDYDTSGNDGCLNENNLTSTYDVNLRLPDGHRIAGMRYFYKDGTTGSSYAFIMRMDGDGTYSELVSVESTGSTGSYASAFETVTPNHYVNNAMYSYVLRFNSGETGSNQEMCSARLWIQATP